MTYPAHYSWFNKISLWLGSKPVIVPALLLAVLDFVICFLLLLGLRVVTGSRQDFTLAVLASVNIAVYSSITVFILLLILIPRLKHRLDKIFGGTLSNRDRTDIAAWLASGILPENKGLHTKLNGYLDHITPYVTGERIFATRNRAFSVLLFVFYALGLAFFVTALVLDPELRTRWFPYVELVFFGYFVYLLNPWSKGPKRAYTLLNRRNIARITARRQELDAEGL